MTWNFNMDEAPRGETIKVERKVGNHVVTIERHVPVNIIAAGNNRVVTVSQWIPDQQRWNMFSKNTPPLAWMPWPEHPEASA